MYTNLIYLIIIILEILALYFLSRRLIRVVYRSIYRLTRSRGKTMYLYAFLFLPGTFIHEMSHFLAALFLLVPVGKMELFPKMHEDDKGFGLGSVAIAKTDPIRRFIIGVAPLTLGLSIILVLIYLISTDNFIDAWWAYLLVGVIIFQIANSMFASKKDLEGAIIFFVLVLLIILILILLGVNVTSFLYSVFSNPGANDFLMYSAVFLFIPIAIDAIILSTFKLFDK